MRAIPPYLPRMMNTMNAEVAMDTSNVVQHRVSAGKLAWGVVLLFVGGYAFLEAVDLLHARELWRLWPLILIVTGLANEIDALRARKSDGSFVGLAIGVWMLFGTQRWFGLTIRDAFPIAFVVAGLFVIVHAFLDDPNAKKQKTVEEDEGE